MSPRVSPCASTSCKNPCRLIRRILELAPGRAPPCTCAPAPRGAVGVGLIEGWRGPVLVALEDGSGRRDSPLPPA